VEAASIDESPLLQIAPRNWADEGQERLATPQEQQLSALVAMGFNFLAVQMAMHEVDTMGLEEVVDFLSNEMHTWQHPFLRNTYSASEGETAGSCVLCGEGGETHREEVVQMSLRYQQSKTFLRRSVLSLTVVLQDSSPQCPICSDSIRKQWKAEACDEHLFCQNCALDHVASKIDEGQNIYCPFHDCAAVLTVQEIKQLVGTQMVEKWERKRLERNPMYHHCPKVNCSGYILGIANQRQTFCPVCKRSLCSHCGKKWHPEITCKSLSRKEMQGCREVKACPCCERFIEKNQGCDHMTCQVCLHEWCWQCRFPYTVTHFVEESADYCPVLRRVLIPMEPPPHPLPDPDLSCCKRVLYCLLNCANFCIVVLIAVCCVFPCMLVFIVACCVFVGVLLVFVVCCVFPCVLVVTVVCYFVVLLGCLLYLLFYACVILCASFAED